MRTLIDGVSQDLSIANKVLNEDNGIVRIICFDKWRCRTTSEELTSYIKFRRKLSLLKEQGYMDFKYEYSYFSS